MIVLDAAALVGVVLDQPPKVWVLEQIAGEDVCAPAHQPAEVLSAIARLVRSGELNPDIARAALDEATALSQELVLPSAAHLSKALGLQDRIRVLDGLCVALAIERGSPLVTTTTDCTGHDRLVRSPPLTQMSRADSPAARNPCMRSTPTAWWRCATSRMSLAEHPDLSAAPATVGRRVTLAVEAPSAR